MENYLRLFEQAIQKQAEVVGEETALEQAKKAGLGVSREGHIVSCAGNPQLVLLRLVKYFTAGGNLLALAECMPLINAIAGEIGAGAGEENTDENVTAGVEVDSD